jgi:hypothetical protein
MAGFNDGYSLEAASDGREFLAPDINGVPSVKMTIRHAQSDIFRRVMAVELATLGGSLAGIECPIERQRLVEESSLRAMSYLVAAWELEEECTQPNVLALLQKRPYLAKWIDQQSVRSADFFAPASTD